MYSIAYCSIKGDRRKINEDAILIQKDIFSDSDGYIEIDTKENILLAVADGMGGYAKGNVAAYTVLHHLANKKPKDAHSFIGALIETKDVLEDIASKENITLGTAFTGVLCENGNCLIVSVGDCRVYKVSSDKSMLLSKDHTLINHLKEIDFDIDEQIIEKQKNFLTSAITGGTDNDNFEIFQKSFSLEKGEKLVLCSDGFWNVFEKDIIKITQSKEPIKYMKKFIKGRGIDDDCSVIILQEKRNDITKKKHYNQIKSYVKNMIKKI